MLRMRIGESDGNKEIPRTILCSTLQFTPELLYVHVMLPNLNPIRLNST